MTEAKHTELPWNAGVSIVTDSINRVVAEVSGDTAAERAENAALIARSANSHYALVEALENMVKMWEFLNPQYDLLFEKKIGVTLSKARATLKQAKGESE